MTGVGNDHALRIWYRALTTYLTSSSNYAAARTASISAARDLYGAGSAEEIAVWNAFHGINVGAAWTGGGTGTTYNEVEANGTLATANAVGDTVTRIVGYVGAATDQDYFKVNVAGGKTLTVTMTGPAGLNYDLALLNGSGTVLRTSQGSTSTESVSYKNTGKKAAVFYLQVSGAGGASSTASPYTLALTR
jgi:hypothetical protein